jgi:hypothetical protein
VATTTTGIFTAGNKSTGIFNRFTVPITTMARQAIKMKYGYRIANDDIYFATPSLLFLALS